jgi:hypothetical protein
MQCLYILKLFTKGSKPNAKHVNSIERKHKSQIPQVGFYRGKKARDETSFTEYLAKHGYGLELTFFWVVFFITNIETIP